MTELLLLFVGDSPEVSGAPPVHGDSLLLETGDYLLQEDGSSSLLLE